MFNKTKSSLAVTLSVAMLASMVVVPGVASAATAKQLSGLDRYETALKIVQDGWTASTSAVITTGEVMADALAAAPLAYAKGQAPILLTKTNSIPAGVLAELKTLGVKNVYIVGGVGAVSKAVADELAAAGLTITRVQGMNRFETSLAVAKEAFGTTPAEVVIANGISYADALSVSSIAAKKGMPILLVNNSVLSAEQKAYIAGKNVYAVGGVGVLNAAVVTETNATRLGGADRYDTNAAILSQFKPDYSKIYLAKGTQANLVDALSGSVLAAKTNSPVVLVNENNALSVSLATVVKANITAASTTVLLGGTVTQVAASAVEALKPQELAIKSVNAINARDIVVNFNGPADDLTAGTKANYEIKVNNVVVNAANYTVTVDKNDAAKVNIQLVVGSALHNGDFVTVKVLKAVANAALKPMTADSTTALPVFSDTMAPTVTKVEAVGNDVVVTFDDYITTLTDLANVVKFNGSRVVAANYVLVDKTLTLTGANNPSLAAGSYDVTLSNVIDIAANNSTFLTKTLTVTNDFTIPAFVSVKATSTNVFAVKFNKSLAVQPTVSVKKNGYALTTTSIIQDGTDSTIYNVTVADNGLVTVYNTNENSTALEVAVSGIKDTKNTIGSAVTTNVTLVKDTTAPTLVLGNSSITGNAMNIQFNEALQNPDANKVIVTDKDGIRVSGVTATITNDARYGANTVLTLTKAGLADGAYTIALATGAVEDTSANDVAAATLSLTKSAPSSSDLTGITANTSANVITVAYGVDMSDAARSAANYTLDGKALPTGSILYFLSDKKTVVIELPTASVSKSVAYTLGFNGSILTASGAKIAAAEMNKIVNLTDNVKPVLASAKKLTSTTVEVTLSEILASVDGPVMPATVSAWANDFVVKVNGVDVAVSGIVAGSTADKLVLTVGAYNVDQTLTVTVGGTNITLDTKDLAGNVITLGTSVTSTK